MGLGHHLSQHDRGLAGVDEVVDDQPALALADLGDDALEGARLALVHVVVAADAGGIDQPDLELAGDDRRGDEAAAGDRDDALPGAAVGQPPGQRLGVAVQLLPRHGEVLGGMGALCHGSASLRTDAVTRPGI
jgi:hypothetical protein